MLMVYVIDYVSIM